MLLNNRENKYAYIEKSKGGDFVLVQIIWHTLSHIFHDCLFFVGISHFYSSTKNYCVFNFKLH